MKKLTTNEIREIWIEFWKSKGHYLVEPKSLVPNNDDSLLFINSGVATIKKYLSGQENPPSNRLVNSQKSLRTNDIENVGITSRHHTMFEMLGNFSIGDYFKDEAILYAWELLTDSKYFGFNPADLYVTVHSEDQRSYDLWLKAGMEANKIVKTDYNFWEIGKGPGGPNTEIFFDRGETYDARDPYELLEKDLENDRVIEMWNIVFSQYNCDPTLPRSQYPELPQKNIDTGMGLERMACIIQDVPTNFETDNFQKLMAEISQKTNTKYADHLKAYRIIADHIRALTFAINDGVVPSNEGRGYVIRRILRRAVKYGYIDLNIGNEPFLYQLVEVVIAQMEVYYPELRQNQQEIENIIKKEEIKFLETIKEGIKHYNLIVKEITDNILPGELVFKLYDTYGFPYELTEELANEENIIINRADFEKELEKQKTRARDARKDISGIDKQNTFLKTITVTSEFIGYTELQSTSKIVYLTDGEQALTELKKGETGFVILDRTPFYATSGGQKADQGTLNNIQVLDVVKAPNGQHLHYIETNENIKLNEELTAQVDENLRKAISQNHSATHLLQYALTQVLGTGVKQAGSNQDFLRTRFDYTTYSVPTIAEIQEVQKIVNQEIHKKEQVQTKIMNIQEAKATGAKALFDEKYGDEVRVVTMGNSKEFCGGTHVNNTQDIENFLIIYEQSIGSGVRRIEALTGINYQEYKNKIIDNYNQEFTKLNEDIKLGKVVKLDNLAKELGKLQNINEVEDIEISKYEEQLKTLQKLVIINEENATANLQEKIVKITNELAEKLQKYENTQKIEEEVIGVTNKELKELADKLMNKINSGIIILKLKEADKISIVVKVSEDQTATYHAGKMLKELLIPYNGRGGGKATMAQGGGTI